jgi:hypothetical protein
VRRQKPTYWIKPCGRFAFVAYLTGDPGALRLNWSAGPVLKVGRYVLWVRPQP